MQRDMELVRKLLFEIETIPFTGATYLITVDGYTEEQINYHIMLMDQAGFIDAVDTSTLSGPRWEVKSLTYNGHEFLDAIKSDTVWEKSKALVLKNAGTLTIEALKFAVPLVMKQLLPTS